MEEKEIIQHLRRGACEQHADIIESQAERYVGFNMIPTDESELVLGCSKGIQPQDMPPDHACPFGEEKPLDVILQLRLKGVSGCQYCKELPQQGLLSVFHHAVGRPWDCDPINSAIGRPRLSAHLAVASRDSFFPRLLHQLGNHPQAYCKSPTV